MNILFIDQYGLVTVVETSHKFLHEFNYYNVESYTVGYYIYNIIKLGEGTQLKLKFCNHLINSSVYVVKTNKSNGKILDTLINDIIDENYLYKQITNYDSDDSSDIEYDICDQIKEQIC